MISLTGILSLLSALAATGDALSCTTCASFISSSCSDGIRVTCPSGFQCGSTYTETTTGGIFTINTKNFVRRCLPSSECNVKGSISHLQGRVKMASTCCSTDDCTPPPPSLQSQNSDPNGVVCRTCFSEDSTWCYTSDTIQCTGDENMCLLQTTKTTGSSSAIRGCATKSICDRGSQTVKVGGLSTETKYICTSGGISVRTAALTPPIVCLLLLRPFL